VGVEHAAKARGAAPREPRDALGVRAGRRTVPVQPVKTEIMLPLVIPSHRQEGETGPLRRAEQLHERR